MNKIIEEDNNSLTSNSDNVNENNNREKITRNRPLKAERFCKERKQLVGELEKKMGLTEEIKGVLLYDLENNEELKSYLKNKIPEIRKLYKCGTWNFFVKQHTKEGEEPSEISLLKSIFKEENYKLKTIRKMIKKEEITKQYTCIFFYKEYNLTEKYKI